MLMKRSVAAGIFAVCAVAAFAQPADRLLEFEAASVKVNIAGPDGRGRGTVSDTPGRLTMLNMRLRETIAWAYRVQPSQISGPTSLDTEWYDIVAKSTSVAGQEQLRLMLQQLLASRFKLTLHHDTREMPAFVLSLPKGGSSKLHESRADGESGIDLGGPGLIHLKKATIGQFAQAVSGALRGPVIDITGLTAEYDFTLDIAPYLDGAGGAGVDDSKLDIPGIIAQAIRDQLGLKLDYRKTSVEVLVVDRVERPSEN
jgi:uncharacterized protein (TIGR03435 family)